VIVLSSSVTEPFSARTRPTTVAPVFRVADVSARIVPKKVVPVSSVAEEVTCQKTLQACAPFSRTTELFGLIKRDDPAWKMKTESALPSPFSITVVFNDMLLGAA